LSRHGGDLVERIAAHRSLISEVEICAPPVKDLGNDQRATDVDAELSARAGGLESLLAVQRKGRGIESRVSKVDKKRTGISGLIAAPVSKAVEVAVKWSPRGASVLAAASSSAAASAEAASAATAATTSSSTRPATAAGEAAWTATRSAR